MTQVTTRIFKAAQRNLFLEEARIEIVDADKKDENMGKVRGKRGMVP